MQLLKNVVKDVVLQHVNKSDIAADSPKPSQAVRAFVEAASTGESALYFDDPHALGKGAFTALGEAAHDDGFRVTLGSFFGLHDFSFCAARLQGASGLILEVEAAVKDPAAGEDRAAGACPLWSWALPTETTEADYLDRVDVARRAVGSGRLDKVVLARVARREAPGGAGFNLLRSLAALREAHPQAFVFAATRGGDVFLGATPETLLRVRDGRLHTEALAGTAAPGTPLEVLLSREKDRAEHAFVVDALLEALHPICTEVRLPATPELRVLPGLVHLRTPIVARLRSGVTAKDVLATLHPTPAVGGHPRAAALSFLREHEGLERGYYAGPVGYVDANGDGVFAVAIRSALIRGSEAFLFAGAGLVEASDPHAEWQETELKLRTLSEVLS